MSAATPGPGRSWPRGHSWCWSQPHGCSWRWDGPLVAWTGGLRREGAPAALPGRGPVGFPGRGQRRSKAQPGLALPGRASCTAPAEPLTYSKARRKRAFPGLCSFLNVFFQRGVFNSSKWFNWVSIFKKYPADWFFKTSQLIDSTRSLQGTTPAPCGLPSSTKNRTNHNTLVLSSVKAIDVCTNYSIIYKCIINVYIQL